MKEWDKPQVSNIEINKITCGLAAGKETGGNDGLQDAQGNPVS